MNHMCTICHALTPAENSAQHYRWHQELVELVSAMHADYRGKFKALDATQ